MLILTLRTDKPEAEIGLYDSSNQLSYDIWTAHRQLAETIHGRMQQNLINLNRDWRHLKGIVVHKGPGSYTGLRIGISVANALAASLQQPIIGATGEKWLETGINDLIAGKNHYQVLPEYGGEAFVTQPKK